MYAQNIETAMSNAKAFVSSFLTVLMLLAVFAVSASVDAPKQNASAFLDTSGDGNIDTVLVFVDSGGNVRGF